MSSSFALFNLLVATAVAVAVGLLAFVVVVWLNPKK
jgi:hypothetical protein